MKRFVFRLLAILMGSSLLLASSGPKSPPPGNASPAPVDTKMIRSEAAFSEGEQRYRANCSRCHQAPPKFSPAAMGTLIRHMRVRAMITDEDMRAILKFMTQ